LITGGIVDAALGQALDLHTTRMVECPTEDEYLFMIKHSKSEADLAEKEVTKKTETGTFFDIALRLMQVISQSTG